MFLFKWVNLLPHYFASDKGDPFLSGWLKSCVLNMNDIMIIVGSTIVGGNDM
jgi:hypothetical protein